MTNGFIYYQLGAVEAAPNEIILGSDRKLGGQYRCLSAVFKMATYLFEGVGERQLPHARMLTH